MKDMFSYRCIPISGEVILNNNVGEDMKFTRCQNVDCNKEYDFNDLIDVAVQAQKDKLINHLKIDNVDPWLSFEKKCGEISTWDKSCFVKGIDWIKSLYTETFVIENNHDLMRAIKGDNGVLSNGEIFSVLSDAYSYTNKDKLMILINNEKLNVTLPILKGATVTQKRSINE